MEESTVTWSITECFCWRIRTTHRTQDVSAGLRCQSHELCTSIIHPKHFPTSPAQANNLASCKTNELYMHVISKRTGLFLSRTCSCLLISIICILQAHSDCDSCGLWQHPDSLPGCQLWDTVLTAWTAILAVW